MRSATAYRRSGSDAALPSLPTSREQEPGAYDEAVAAVSRFAIARRHYVNSCKPLNRAVRKGWDKGPKEAKYNELHAANFADLGELKDAEVCLIELLRSCGLKAIQHDGFAYVDIHSREKVFRYDPGENVYEHIIVVPLDRIVILS